MLTARLILLIIGLIFLALSAMDIKAPKANLQSLGLACWLLAVILTR